MREKRCGIRKGPQVSRASFHAGTDLVSELRRVSVPDHPSRQSGRS